MNDYEDGIAAARKELQGYLVAVDQANDLLRRLFSYRNRMGTIPSHAPQIGLRKSWKLVPVMDPITGKTLSMKRREPALVPCHISVQTQPDPHAEENRIIEADYLEYKYQEKIRESQELSRLIEERILAVPAPHGKILHLRYIEGLRLEQITARLDWFYSYKQVKRHMTRAISVYAKQHGFINEEKDVP